MPSLLLRDHNIRLVRILKLALFLVRPHQTVTLLQNALDVLDDLGLLVVGQDADVALAARAVDDDLLGAEERVAPHLLLRRREVRLVARGVERRAPEPEPELRRAALVALDAVAQLRDPRRAVAAPESARGNFGRREQGAHRSSRFQISATTPSGLSTRANSRAAAS